MFTIPGSGDAGLKKLSRYRITDFGATRALSSLAYSYAPARVKTDLSIVGRLREPEAADRILVFAPHCDDEVLGAGGLILRSIENGAAVRAVIVTNGDNNLISTNLQCRTIRPGPRSYIRAGEARQKESVRALASLGMTKKDIIFLSYPDKGLRALFTTNRRDSKPYKSPATRRTRSPYPLSYEPETLYSGENLLRNIKRIILEFSPTIVVAPHGMDMHPDHRFTHLFVKEAMEYLYGGNIPGYRGPESLYYLIHHRMYPRPRGLRPEENLLPPLPAGGMFWRVLPLSTGERDAKAAAIACYTSQIRVPELGKLMRSFARGNELFESTAM